MPTLRIPIDLTWDGTTGSPGVNVWHCRVTSGVPGVDLDLGIIAGILEDFYTTISTNMPPDYTASFAGEAYGVGDDEGDTHTADPWEVDGIGSSGYLPPHVAYLVNWKTASGGRQGRGRTFLGPLSANVNEGNGTPSELYRADIITAVNALVAQSEAAANGALGVYSRVGNTFRDFTSGAVPNKWASLRSRRD